MSVAVLLSVYNGDKYLKQLLDSVSSQDFESFSLLVRDDGSEDCSLAILAEYGVIALGDGINVGVKESFLQLLKYALVSTDSKYFMFCDQDDIWLPNKISNTVHKMQAMESTYGVIPLLVHTDLQVVDEQLDIIASSMWEYEFCNPDKNSLSRLLMQNTVTGCTVMINRSLAEMCAHIPDSAIMHDWWLALTAACFGKIGYIKEPTIQYRQHSANSVGAKDFNNELWSRFPGLLKKIFVRDSRYLESLEVNINQARVFLEMFESRLPADKKSLLTGLISLEQQSFLRRRITLLRFCFFRQGWLRNIVLLLRI